MKKLDLGLQSTISVTSTLFLCLLLLLMTGSFGYAQTGITVTGTVLEKDTSIPVPGATVVEDGTNNGVITDFDGNFSIDVSSENATLEVSFLGFATEKIEVNGQNSLTIYLEVSGQQLDEVVIVGYGAQKKTDVTGSVASLKAESFNQGVVVAPEELLQAKISGVRVTSSSGEPGAANTVTIRGAGALRSGDSPLYVVDGVPISNAATAPAGGNTFGTAIASSTAASNPIAFLNPSDIASLDVLKDASATAIYGSRGSNGVILITTKRAKAGTSNLSFDAYTSFGSIANKLDVGTAADFGGGAVDTDWQDEVFRSAVTNNYNLSYGAADENSSILVSLNAFDQEGIIDTSNLKRYTARLNSTFYALKDNKLKIDFNIVGSQTTSNGVPRSDAADTSGELITATLGTSPTETILGSDGEFFAGNAYPNPVGLLGINNDITKVNRVLSNLTATYKFSSNFNYQVNLGADISTGSREQELLPNTLVGVVANNGSYITAEAKNENLLFENFLTYNLESGENRFNFLLGYANQVFEQEVNSYAFQGYTLSNVSAIDNPRNAPNAFGLPFAVNEQTKLESVFGRINYSYGDRLDLTASLRADGSSKFAEGNQWGIFPAVAASYALINDGSNSINSLKARVGWGQTGNQNVPGNPTVDTFDFTPSGQGIAPFSVGNPDLEWEISNQLNVGLDFSLFDNRVYGNLDYFNKVNEKMILFVASEPPAVSGQWVNLPGDITNNGVEIFVGADLVKNENVTWNVSANATSISNEVNLRDGEEIITGGLSGRGLSGEFVQVIRSGEALGSFLLPTANADGTASAERTIQGSGIPNFVYGFNTALKIKDWDFSANFSGVSGNKIYNNTAQFLFATGENLTTELLNETNPIPAGASSYFLEDGAFLRLQNATLGYNLNLGDNSVFSKLRLYATGQNLFTITDYTGFDPEVSTPRSLNGVLSYGVDFAAYPRARTLILGFNASF